MKSFVNLYLQILTIHHFHKAQDSGDVEQIYCLGHLLPTIVLGWKHDEVGCRPAGDTFSDCIAGVHWSNVNSVIVSVSWYTSNHYDYVTYMAAQEGSVSGGISLSLRRWWQYAGPCFLWWAMLLPPCLHTVVDKLGLCWPVWIRWGVCVCVCVCVCFPSCEILRTSLTIACGR